MSESILGDYEKNGYVIVKNIVSTSRVNAILESIFELYCKYSEENDEDFKKSNQPWKTDLFHTKLIELRKNDPQSFGAIYDSLKTSLTVNQLVCDDSIVKNAAKFLKSTPSGLSISEPMCRMDTPFDKRNVNGWHQERAYFPQNRNGLHGLGIWIPLMDVTKDMGAMHFSQGSHAGGLLHSTREEKKNHSHSRQISLSEDDVNKYEDIIHPLNLGDAVFLNMLVFHRSGENISNQVRISVQSRFHTAVADDFIPFDLMNHYNPYIKQKLIEKNYDCSDIPDNELQLPVA